METVTPFFQPDTALNLSGNVDSVNGNAMEATIKATVAPMPTPVTEPAPVPSPTSDANENQQVQKPNHTETPEITDATDPKGGSEDSHNNNQDEDVESAAAETEEQNMVSVSPGGYGNNVATGTRFQVLLHIYHFVPLLESL